MKVLVVLSVLVVVLAASKVTIQEQKCQEDPKTRVDEALLNKTRNGEFSDDEQLKKHVLCVHLGLGLVSPDGKLDTEKLKQRWIAYFKVASHNKLGRCFVNYETAEKTSWALYECEWAATH